MKIDLKNIDNKKLALFAIPIGLACLFTFVFFSASSNNEMEEMSTKALIPDSSQDSVLSKREAYEKERSEQKIKEYEKEHENYSDVKFYDDLTSEEQAQEIAEPVEEKTSEQLYAEIVQKKTSPVPHKKASQKISQTQRYGEPGMSATDSLYEEMVTKKKPSYILSERQKQQQGNYDAVEVTEEPTQEQRGDIIVGSSQNRSRKRTSAKQNKSNKNLIQACIHSTQTITAGSTVMMRLLEPVKLTDNTEIPQNTIFYGIANIAKDRMSIKVSSIKYNNHIAKVDYTIYDNDAIEGLNLPDNVKNQLAKKSTSSAIDNIDAPSVSTNIVGGVVNGTASVVKSITKNKVDEVNVTIKANYKIFIK